MFKPQYDELHSFLEWRRQTRFLRHYGGPIIALGLFVTCLWFVWKACESRRSTPKEEMPETQVKSMPVRDIDRTLHAAQFSKR